MAIHAPTTNFVTSTTSSTVPVIAVPKPETQRERRRRLRSVASVSVPSRRVQCRTMPVWLRVNETKTPTV